MATGLDSTTGRGLPRFRLLEVFVLTAAGADLATGALDAAGRANRSVLLVGAITDRSGAGPVAFAAVDGPEFSEQPVRY